MRKMMACAIAFGTWCCTAYADAAIRSDGLCGTNSVASESKVASSVQSEVKVEPGAVLTIWKGKDMDEAEIAMIVDKGKSFAEQNAFADPAARGLSSRTCKWSGILNIEEAGVYVFNVTFGLNSATGGGAVVSINGTEVVSFSSNGTSSKRVAIPGPVKLEVRINGSDSTRRRRSNNSVMLRYKKAGMLQYIPIMPETLYHQVK